VEDQGLAEPLTLTAGEIALKAENLSTAKDRRISLSPPDQKRGIRRGA
jgi:hypothetical protein